MISTIEIKVGKSIGSAEQLGGWVDCLRDVRNTRRGEGTSHRIFGESPPGRLRSRAKGPEARAELVI